MSPAAAHDLWFRRHSTPTRPTRRLVCFPHAGGAASAYRGWSRWLPPDVELLAVRYPGREDRLAEPCVGRMEELADAVAAALSSFRDLPLAFFGHSLGASLAHEVALRLERGHGTVLDRLFVSARRAPHRLEPDDLYLRSDAEVVAELRALDPVRSAVLDDPGLRELVLPAIRGDYEIVGTYRPGRAEPVRCPVVGYAGADDPKAPPAEVAEWAAVAPAGFATRVFPGGHFYLVDQERAVVMDVVGRWVAG
ncbi:pyochelin biosynthetic protein PchC [Streptoalloteichus tenebrarius]|uniref:Pyochelin biosynthetic protein PchC n=1 Tax=Streptoalloteichus tenebrarius (strain ATCC 17920 / DSM 40477 / JCM 4838 / CBS 697.72 / NBRC 16177 / NCIMB 11028 / NRRL B-12390 / A12253. 1 / ISP 5477) TaxID=1933 RepID=A0ABT1I1A9_STRSD|nr:thioesterase domain-containing protein [Streptoalloteichus tenebrarius]MCP2261573.1 pyochelin biosynthetic protein PchC [Streptoalloteichus tenebrarius]BFF02651.1 alpha/beta fold hydrolase [Streptoalloteichus tenebrarius]